MGVLSEDLQALGYEPTGRESPFDERGKLWTKGYELVCDETGIVVERDNRADFRYERPERTAWREKRYTYRNSGRVKMIGGFLGSYRTEGQIKY